MRLVFDLQGAQSACRFRGIGRYCLALAQGLARQRGEHELIIALNAAFPDTISPIRAAFADLLPAECIRVWSCPQPVRMTDPRNAQRCLAAEILREHWIASMNPDWLLIGSLMEGFGDDAVTSIHRANASVNTAVIHYDLIPWIHPKHYLTDECHRRWYHEKIDHLRRADMLLSISASSAGEATDYLGFPGNKVINISTAADAHFQPLRISDVERTRLTRSYGLNRPFVMYTGGVDQRKNLEGLLRAWAALPVTIKKANQLAIVCAMPEYYRTLLAQLIRDLDLSHDEVCFTDYVPDDDLLMLYNMCELFVFPSWHEGFGLPVLEAMQCGRPVLAANATSLPEVVGRSDALFDPNDPHEIAKSIERALTDTAWRQELAAHGLKQARQFNWDASARRAWKALGENLDFQSKSSVALVVSASNYRRPSLALVFIASTTQAGIAEDRLELLRNLTRWYRIDVVIHAADSLNDDMRSICTVRTLEEYQSKVRAYDRILYDCDIGDVPLQWPVWVMDHPGVIVLHERISRDAVPAKDAQTHLGNLHYAHGLIRIQSDDASGSTATCVEDRQTFLINHANPRRRAEDCRNSIEDLYQAATRGVWGATQALAQAPEALWPALAICLARNHPPQPHSRQLLVDVSELVQRDAKSGIQRVARAILSAWLQQPPQGYLIEPIYASSDALGYRYARRWRSRFLNKHNERAEDESVEAWPGDIFFGLDLQCLIVSLQQPVWQEWRRRGVKVGFLLHDILPISLPRAFDKGAASAHSKWLLSIATSDFVIAVSQSVAAEYRAWLDAQNPQRALPLHIGWNHHGADTDNSQPTTGLPPEAPHVMAQLAARPSLLMVGTVEPRKGHAQSLAACDRLWQQGLDFNLVIVGKQGWLVDALAERLRQHPQADQRLFWLQGISDEYLDKLYAAATGCLMASEGEGFGLPLIEAARHGLPLLARDLPVFREVAGDHATYFPDDLKPETLAIAIAAWLKGLQAGTYTPSSGLHCLTWEQSAAQLLDAILKGDRCQPWHSRRDDTWHFWGNDVRLDSECGQRRGQSINTTGQAGCLLHGTGFKLPAGRYRAIITGRAEHLTGGEGFELIEGEPARCVVKSRISVGSGQAIHLQLAFQLEHAVQDLALRLWVDKPTQANVSTIQIDRDTTQVPPPRL